MTVCSKTDIGLVRQSNQDACAAGLFPGGAAWAVVCDGMGGANGGNVASEQAVTTIRAAMEQGYRPAMDEDGLISLCPAGEEIARRIYERHQLLTEFFTRLGVDPEVAAADACKVEHDLSEETFQKIKEHAQKGTLPGETS